jgi:hypothetical protein
LLELLPGDVVVDCGPRSGSISPMVTNSPITSRRAPALSSPNGKTHAVRCSGFTPDFWNVKDALYLFYVE